MKHFIPGAFVLFVSLFVCLFVCLFCFCFWFFVVVFGRVGNLDSGVVCEGGGGGGEVGRGVELFSCYTGESVSHMG